MSLATAIPKDIRKLLAFGTGVGIEIGAADLEVAAARVRPSGIRVAGRLTIHDYATRPAAEWGAEYQAFLKSLGMAECSATVLLPRREVIVRQVSLPGVAPKDMESAIRLQLDSSTLMAMTRWCGDGRRWSTARCWSESSGARAVDRYIQLFERSGHRGRQLHLLGRRGACRHPPERRRRRGGFVALSQAAAGGIEVYGESPARPVFSAEFDLPPRARRHPGAFRIAPAARYRAAHARGRSARTRRSIRWKTIFPATHCRTPRRWLGLVPWLAPAANVLPAEHRRLSSHRAFFPTFILAVLLAVVGGGVAVYFTWSQHRYLKQLDAEIARLEPRAQRAATLDRAIDNTRARAQLLDEFRGRTSADLNVLNELTRLIEPPAWTSSIDITRDSVRLTGEAQQAAPLPKLLDSSPFFVNTAPDMVGRAPSGSGETFQLHTTRRAGK